MDKLCSYVSDRGGSRAGLARKELLPFSYLNAFAIRYWREKQKAEFSAQNNLH